LLHGRIPWLRLRTINPTYAGMKTILCLAPLTLRRYGR
jgi:hypothetical protein